MADRRRQPDREEDPMFGQPAAAAVIKTGFSLRNVSGRTFLPADSLRAGELVWVDLGPGMGMEMGGITPCVIMSLLYGSETVKVMPLKRTKRTELFPTQVRLPVVLQSRLPLPEGDWVFGCEKVREVSKQRILSVFGQVDEQLWTLCAEVACAILLGASFQELEMVKARILNEGEEEENDEPINHHSR